MYLFESTGGLLFTDDDGEILVEVRLGAIVCRHGLYLVEMLKALYSSSQKVTGYASTASCMSLESDIVQAFIEHRRRYSELCATGAFV
ncbi:hypothetical protein Tco_0355317 [Tanacetum coccineum]